MSTPNEITAKNLLAFVLVGEMDGEAYELDPEQVKRMEWVVDQIAQSRMFAATEIPPVETINFSQTPPPPKGGEVLN